MAEYRVTLTFSSSDPLHRENLALCLVLLIATFGFVLRFYHLGNESLWIDETLTLIFSRQSLASLWAPSGEADLTPPLWYTLQKAWLVFGESEFALRTPAALAGVLAVPVMFAVGRLTSGYRAGLLASLLLATSGVHLYYSQEARAYSLLFLSAAIALWGLIYILANPPRSMAAFSARADLDKRRQAQLAWAAYGFGTLLALYSHNTAVLLQVWANVCWLIVWLRTGRNRPFLLAWVLINAVVTLAFAWWLPIVVHQSVGTLATFPTGKRTASLAVMIDLIRSVYGIRYVPMLAGTTTAISLTLAGFGSWRLRRNLAANLVLTGVVIFVPAVSAIFSLWRPILVDRILVWPVSALLVLVAIGIVGLPRLPAVLVTVVMIGLNSIGLLNYYQTTLKSDWRAAAMEVADTADKTDALVFSPHYERFPFDYYFRRDSAGSTLDVYAIWSDNGVSTLRSTNRGKLTDLSLAEFGRKYQRAWLIVSTPWTADSVKSMFDSIGTTQPLRRIGDIAIFEFDRRPGSSH